MKQIGVVSAGHEDTVRAAESILRTGGNAFDAIIAAQFAACVAEPVLTSLGGGGYLLAHPVDRKPVVYDFFTHTPKRRPESTETDFHAISADFGTARQTFHIGRGSIATPGIIKGMFSIHKDLCTLPVSELIAPAISLARNGVRINAFQAYAVSIVSPIFSATPEARAVYAGGESSTGLVKEGEILQQPQLADTLELLAHEGEAEFYCGEIAEKIVDLCKEAGLIKADDLSDYEVIRRIPLAFDYRGARININPPPSSGGALIACGLKLLESFKTMPKFGSLEYLERIARTLALTHRARLDAHVDDSHHPDITRLLDADWLAPYRDQLNSSPFCARGTTHMSVLDAAGNSASLSVSNGEGCGHMIPGTGVMLNNMLGEEDLHPQGFQCWPVDTRMTSMMSPTRVQTDDGRIVVLGSGGSNRLRSAILQVLVNLIDYGAPLDDAVERPRAHYERGLLNLETGFDTTDIDTMIDFPERRIWDGLNLYFGGTHAVMHDADGFHGTGDPRRGGTAMIVV